MSTNMEEKIVFTTEDGQEVTFYVIEETTIGGKNFLLVATEGEEEQEQEAMILQMTDDGEGEEVVYEPVEDEEQLKAISKVFEELLEDVDLEM